MLLAARFFIRRSSGPWIFGRLINYVVINSDMRDFIDHVVRLIDAQKRYVDSTKAAFRQFCDYSMSGDEEVEHYCKNTGIPYEVEY